MRDQDLRPLDNGWFVRVWKRGKQPLYSYELLKDTEPAVERRDEFDTIDEALVNAQQEALYSDIASEYKRQGVSVLQLSRTSMLAGWRGTNHVIMVSGAFDDCGPQWRGRVFSVQNVPQALAVVGLVSYAV